MTEYKMVDVDETSYLFQERTCSMDPQDISATMGEVFQNVFAFVADRKIKSAHRPMSVYSTYDPQKMTFRAGFGVSADDASKADGDVKAATLPAGQVLHFTHVGPYAKLRDSYGEMMKYLEEKNLTVGAPTWEVYVDDPQTTPEEKLRTEVYVSLA
ncbi:MAG: GyrI-like domain-containing protein [Pseudomonadota bacterium]